MSQARVLSNYPNASLTNKIINGCMRIDQRNAGASVTPTTDGQYTLDRWMSSLSQASKFSIQRSSTAPVGFTNSLLCTVVSPVASPVSGDYFGFLQRVEGFNAADLGWGTANAQTVTVSFWVRSSIAGTYSVAIHDSSVVYSYVTTYTVNSANTFELKTVTIPGPTSGTWNKDNSSGLSIYFTLGMGSSLGNATPNIWNSSLKLTATGSVNLMATNGATLYITGVDLRKGSYSAAPTFDMRHYGQELALCQRYYWKAPNSFSFVFVANTYNSFQFKVSMRTAPTVTVTPTSGTTTDIQANTEGFYAVNTTTAGASATASAEL